MRNLSRRIPIRGRGYSVAYQPCGPLMCNMYSLICNVTGDAVIVDPSIYRDKNTNDEVQSLQTHLQSNNASVKHILLTHGHIDHVAGISHVRTLFPQASLHLHPLEEENYYLNKEQGPMFGMSLQQPDDLPTPTDELTEGQIIKVGETIQLRVVHTPGHAPGHVAFVDDSGSTVSSSSSVDSNNGDDSDNKDDDELDSNTNGNKNNGNVVIGGDLLFRGSVGRTDFFNSSIDDLLASIRRLYEELDEHSIILSGHTTPTFLHIERKSNPFVDYALDRPSEWYEEVKERHGWKSK